MKAKTLLSFFALGCGISALPGKSFDNTHSIVLAYDLDDTGGRAIPPLKFAEYMTLYCKVHPNESPCRAAHADREHRVEPVREASETVLKPNGAFGKPNGIPVKSTKLSGKPSLSLGKATKALNNHAYFGVPHKSNLLKREDGLKSSAAYCWRHQTEATCAVWAAKWREMANKAREKGDKLHVGFKREEPTPEYCWRHQDEPACAEWREKFHKGIDKKKENPRPEPEDGRA
jgi:hypothetical protein